MHGMVANTCSMIANILDTTVITCGELGFQRLWDAADCCPDCHDGRGDCGSLKACVVYLSQAVEMEVCCAVLDAMAPRWRAMTEPVPAR